MSPRSEQEYSAISRSAQAHHSPVGMVDRVSALLREKNSSVIHLELASIGLDLPKSSQLFQWKRRLLLLQMGFLFISRCVATAPKEILIRITADLGLAHDNPLTSRISFVR